MVRCGRIRQDGVASSVVCVVGGKPWCVVWPCMVPLSVCSRSRSDLKVGEATQTW